MAQHALQHSVLARSEAHEQYSVLQSLLVVTQFSTVRQQALVAVSAAKAL
jgi:hypothetical protein